MADELTLGCSLKMEKDGKSVGLSRPGLRFDQTGTDYVLETQTVGITEEALRLGDITTPGRILITNLDQTNFVTFRRATGEGAAVKLMPGEPNSFRCGSTAPFLIADTAPCEVEFLLLEA